MQWRLVAQGAFRIAKVRVALISRLFQRHCAPRPAGLVSPKTKLELAEDGGRPVIALVDTAWGRV